MWYYFIITSQIFLLCNKWGIIESFYFALFDDEITLTHSEQRPPNIYSLEEKKKIYFIIKLATQISLFSLQISKTWMFCF